MNTRSTMMRAGWLATGVLLLAACSSCRNGAGSGETTSAPPVENNSAAANAPVTTSVGESAAADKPLAAGGKQPAAAAEAQPGASPGAARTWSFDENAAAGAPPSGFSFGRTGEGREGKWVVRAEASAPSGANVLAQVDSDGTDYRFPVAWANEPSLRDVELRVRCKQVSGKVDQACGVVFRLRDANNYYLTRANALEGNVRLYYVKDGHRQQIASYSGKVASGAWHSVRVAAQGDHIQVWFDDAKAIDQHDKTFTDAGKVGLWTKADSVTYFDDLSVKPQ